MIYRYFNYLRLLIRDTKVEFWKPCLGCYYVECTGSILLECSYFTVLNFVRWSMVENGVFWKWYWCLQSICRFLVGVGWNVKDLRHYALRTKHLRMKVCSILLYLDKMVCQFYYVLFLSFNLFVLYCRWRESSWMGFKPSSNAESWSWSRCKACIV